ncbi:MAG: hypothetical protein LBN93_09670 [Candidatus Symbiothrix sp.]|jgi:hypothetical protein|nr:hypothetical protein [Candidatus Symbiothrix sp.]
MQRFNFKLIDAKNSGIDDFKEVKTMAHNKGLKPLVKASARIEKETAPARVGGGFFLIENWGRPDSVASTCQCQYGALALRIIIKNKPYHLLI